MSILKSNNANFKITEEWLQQRGYKLWYRHHVDGRIILRDHPERPSEPPTLATRVQKFSEKIELHYMNEANDPKLTILIGVIRNKVNSYRRTTFRPDEIDKLIELERIWNKKREN